MSDGKMKLKSPRKAPKKDDEEHATQGSSNIQRHLLGPAWPGDPQPVTDCLHDLVNVVLLKYG
ncbi:hypothetical protein E2C01_015940 [Portunus trituberculatus]|uniref:Uncharacterized protein n=1 Tax=Portunus trituberculatus TaxID=210409 RepID=A0A5B7DMT3_PORTR|nr:hypothetical protein [Portunus trituberculatus]